MKALSIRPRRVLALITMLLGMMVMTLVPAFGQQEVDPTWYDPWGAPQATAAQAARPQVAKERHQAKIRPVSTRVATKARAKQAARPKAS